MPPKVEICVCRGRFWRCLALMCLVSASVSLFFKKAYETSGQIFYIGFITPLTISFLKIFQTSDFSFAMEVPSAVEAGGRLEGGSEQEIKSMDGVSVCVNGSIRVSGKNICKS